MSSELLVESLLESIALSDESLSVDVLVCDSSTRALREVVLVLVRVSVRAAPERSFVTAPMSEFVPVEGSAVAADESFDGGDVELASGFVVLSYDGVAVDEEGDDIVELELVVVLLELLLLLGELVDDGAVLSAVRHSLLRRVSVELALFEG